MTQSHEKKMQTISDIAKQHGIETLETRNIDSLDFHDLAAWTIEEMLVTAYNAGMEAGNKRQ